MQKLISFFKQYAFEWLLLIFSVGIPFALGMGPAFYGILATFLIFLTLRRLSYWVFFIVFLFVLITCVLFLPQIIWFGHPPATMIGAFLKLICRNLRSSSNPSPFIRILSPYLLFFWEGISSTWARKKLTLTVRNNHLSP